MAKVTIDTELLVRTYPTHKGVPLSREELLCGRCKHSKVTSVRSSDNPEGGERMDYFECDNRFWDESDWPMHPSCEQIISCSEFCPTVADFVENY